MTLPVAQADGFGLGFPIAFAAGALSFFSPCVLPLVPGYLSAVTGVQVAGLDRVGWRQVLVPSLLFVATFSVIFVALGVGAFGVGSAFRQNRDAFNVVAGAIIIAMGLLLVASMFVSALNREAHVDALMQRAGRGGPVVVGAAFAIAWTPCVGPTLATILSLASTSDSVARGAVLLTVYSAGLAVPFLATALAFSRMTNAFAWVRRHYSVLMGAGGVVLVVMGVLVLTGELFQLNIEAQRMLDRLGIDVFSEL
ncbi:MAG: cytochrome c biogenesis CcdA family protein [Solirubrobacterales bacterium]